MGLENPELSRAKGIAGRQTVASFERLHVGESLPLEQIFRNVGQRLVAEGLAPEIFATDEWAEVMAYELREKYTGASSTGSQPNDTEK